MICWKGFLVILCQGPVGWIQQLHINDLYLLEENRRVNNLTLLSCLLQIVCKIFLNYIVIIENITDPDDNFYRNL